MNTHADKTQGNKSQSMANDLSQKQGGNEPTFQFEDNRPEALAQRILQEMVTNSPQAKDTAQMQAMASNHTAWQPRPVQNRENNTGLPDNLKSGIENLSGYSLDDVKVHYNSDKPAQLQAHAYAQGTDVHIAPGQEKHLPHEAWHVVQQKQGRVKPTMQMKGMVNVNDDMALEREADVMSEKAVTQKWPDSFSVPQVIPVVNATVQRYRLVKKYRDYEEVEFSRKEPKPIDGIYRNDGYIYEEISSHQTGIIYERRLASSVSIETDIEEEEETLPGARLKVPTAVEVPDEEFDEFFDPYMDDIKPFIIKKIQKRNPDLDSIFMQAYLSVLESIVSDRVEQWWEDHAGDSETKRQELLRSKQTTSFLGITVPPGAGIHNNDIAEIRERIREAVYETLYPTGSRSPIYKEDVDDAIYYKVYNSPKESLDYEELKKSADDNASEGKVGTLIDRLQLLEEQQNRESMLEMNFYVNLYGAKKIFYEAVPDPDRKKKLAVTAVADQVKNQVNSRRARSFKYDPSEMNDILQIELPPAPKIGDSSEEVDENFDVIARKAAEPPKNAVHEADLATLDTQRGIPIDRVSVTGMTNEPNINVADNPPTEKAMAIGFQGAIDFGGKLSSGKGGAERIYGTLFPKGAIRGWGVDRKGMDAPSLEAFRDEVRSDEDLNKLFVIRYETSTKKEGQVHLYNDWLVEEEGNEGVFYSHLELLRKHVIAVVEIEDVEGEGNWEVVKVKDFSESYGELF